MSKKRQEIKEKRLADPADAMREMYDRFWKQAADQWETVARDPQFLSMMAANLDQSLEMRARVQEMMAAALRTMNLPSRDDLLALGSRLDQLGRQIAELDRKLAAHDSSASSRAQRAVRRTGVKKRAAKRKA